MAEIKNEISPGADDAGHAGVDSAPTWSIYEIALREDPHAAWRDLRERTPVFDSGDGVYFFTRWEDVDTILRDARHEAGRGVSASFGASEGLAFDVMQSWLMSLDGDAQKRARGLVRREFTPRRVEALRATASTIADDLISTLESQADETPVDLIDGLAFALPSAVICALFGIPLPEWNRTVEPLIRNVGDQPTDGLAMIEGLARYFDSLLAEDRIPEGLLRQLLAPDAELGSLSRLEVVANAVLLVTAAIDTTAGLIGNSIRCLLDRPGLLAQLRAGSFPISAAIDETLRFEPSALSCSRTAGFDFILGDLRIAQGSQLLLGLAAANRDPDRFPDPDVFRLDRESSAILSFGGGRHYCLGAALARMEAEVALDRLLLRSSSEWILSSMPRWQRSNPTIRAHDRIEVRATRRPDAETA